MTLTWTDELSSGLEPIDFQHRQILDLLNQLVIANKSQNNKEKIIDLLEQVTFALEQHFEYEETFLAKAKYHGLSDHKDGHEEISEVLESIKLTLIFDQSVTNNKMINYVSGWFEEHLFAEDVKYFRELLHDKS